MLFFIVGTCEKADFLMAGLKVGNFCSLGRNAVVEYCS